MTELLVVHAPGLSPDQAVRGDLAANLSDLIAEGSFAPFAGGADVAAAVGTLAKDRVRVVTVPFRDIASFDGAVGDLRAQAAGAAVAVVSEAVFISQRFFAEIKPGRAIPAGDLPRLLASMLRASR